MAIITNKEAALIIGVTVNWLNIWRSRGLHLDLLAPKEDWVSGVPSYYSDRVEAFASTYQENTRVSKNGLSVSEAAKILGFSTTSLYNWRKKGQYLGILLKNPKRPGSFRYDKKKVLALAASAPVRRVFPGIPLCDASNILDVSWPILKYWHQSGRHLDIFIDGLSELRCDESRVTALRDLGVPQCDLFLMPSEAASILGVGPNQLRVWRDFGYHKDIIEIQSKEPGIPTLYKIDKVKELAKILKKRRASSLSTKDSAALLGVSIAALLKWTRSGKHASLLTYEVFGQKERRYNKDNILALKSKLRTKNKKDHDAK